MGTSGLKFYHDAPARILDDLATFPTFGRFLSRLGETKPTILIGYIERMEPPLSRFLPAMLAGLMKSAWKDAAKDLIEQWLVEDRYLSDIAWYCRVAEPVMKVS